MPDDCEHFSPVRHPVEGAVPSDLEALLGDARFQVIPLYRDDRDILDHLPALGPVVIHAGRVGASMAWRGTIQRVQHLGDGTLLLGDEGALGWLEPTWRHTAVVMPRESPTGLPALVCFGNRGEWIQRITPMSWASWQPLQTLIEAHRGCLNCLRHEASVPLEHPPFDCPGSLLREAWSDAVSQRDLDRRLAGLGLTRLVAVRAMEGLCTASVAPSFFQRFLAMLTAESHSVQLEITSRHGTQALVCILDRLDWRETDCLLEGRHVVLQLMPELIQNLWFVRPPGTGGAFRFEGYGEDESLALAMSCPPGVGSADQAFWDRMHAALEAEAIPCVQEPQVLVG